MLPPSFKPTLPVLGWLAVGEAGREVCGVWPAPAPRASLCTWDSGSGSLCPQRKDRGSRGWLQRLQLPFVPPAFSLLLGGAGVPGSPLWVPAHLARGWSLCSTIPCRPVAWSCRHCPPAPRGWCTPSSQGPGCHPLICVHQGLPFSAGPVREAGASGACCLSIRRDPVRGPRARHLELTLPADSRAPTFSLVRVFSLLFHGGGVWRGEEAGEGQGAGRESVSSHIARSPGSPSLGWLPATQRRNVHRGRVPTAQSATRSTGHSLLSRSPSDPTPGSHPLPCLGSSWFHPLLTALPPCTPSCF